MITVDEPDLRDRFRKVIRHRRPEADHLRGNSRRGRRRDPGGTPGEKTDHPVPGKKGVFSEMQSTGAISASDCLFRGSDRQHFSEKTHPDSGKRPFQPRIGDLNAFMGREMTTFSNDTVADIRKYGLPADHGLPIAR